MRYLIPTVAAVIGAVGGALCAAGNMRAGVPIIVVPELGAVLGLWLLRNDPPPSPGDGEPGE